MKIVYIADQAPANKSSRKDDLKQAAILAASQSRISISSRRRAQRLFEIVLKEGAGK